MDEENEGGRRVRGVVKGVSALERVIESRARDRYFIDPLLAPLTRAFTIYPAAILARTLTSL